MQTFSVWLQLDTPELPAEVLASDLDSTLATAAGIALVVAIAAAGTMAGMMALRGGPDRALHSWLLVSYIVSTLVATAASAPVELWGVPLAAAASLPVLALIALVARSRYAPSSS